MKGCLHSNRQLSKSRAWARALLLTLAAAGVANSAAAQVWTGSANLGVQVRSTRGGAVAGATVEVRYRRPGGNVGPDAKLTDSRGQANFVGLAEGRWSLEVRHPDYLSYVASLEVAGNRKPEVTSQFLEASGAGRGTLKVKFLRSNQPFGEVVAGTAVSEPPAPPRRTPAPTPTSAAPAPAPSAEEVVPSSRPVSQPVPTPPATPTPPTEVPPEIDARPVPSRTVAPPQPTPEHLPERLPEPKLKTPPVRAAETPKPAVLEPAPPAAPEAPASMPEPVAVPSVPQPEAEPVPTVVSDPVSKPLAETPVPVPAADPEVPPRDAPPEPNPMPEPVAPALETAEAPQVQPAQEPEPVEKPERVVEPEPKPVPSPSLPSAPPTVTEPSAEVSAVPSADAPSEPSELSEPTESTEPSEQVEPMAPTLEAPETATSSLRAYRDRTCSDCKPGEWAVSVEVEAGGGEACRATAERSVRRAMRDVTAVASDKLGDYAGPLPLDPAGMPLALTTEAARNTLARYLEPGASCRLLAAVIPQGARFAGFRFEASDSSGTGECSGSGDCEIGLARFAFSPGIARGLGASIVFTLFENTGDTARTGRMSGFFVPANDWQP